MVPILEVFELGPKLLGMDTTTLSGMATLRVGLVKEPFVPSPSLAYGDLTFANFDGSTAKTPVSGDQPESLDPATGDALLDILPPAGGWRWETTGLTNLPQTVYGFALYNTAGTVLYASELLDIPVELNDVNQTVILASVRMRFNQGLIT